MLLRKTFKPKTYHKTPPRVRASTLSLIFAVAAVFFLILALVSASIPILPLLWYRLQPGTSTALAKILRKPPLRFEDLLVESGDQPRYQPAFDPSLPKLNRLIIPVLKIDTPIWEEPNETFETALQKGVWHVPGFGDPFNRQYPTILTAHRFGYLKWSIPYRLKNSFYNLPKLKIGDEVDIIWNQRQYHFVVYAGEEGEVITDYTADLILYTCKLLESPLRIFRYASLVEE